MITAGPTREAIDPVRYLSNRSSGKMGYALAEAAREMGADVSIVSGPVNMRVPLGVCEVRVQSADEMYHAVMQHKHNADIVIACAAVADFAPKTAVDQKIKKSDSLTIELQKTKDILAALGEQKEFYLVGFAAETNDLLAYAKDKLERKNLDMIVANDVSRAGVGFDSDLNAVSILKRSGGMVELDCAEKIDIARGILREIEQEVE